MGLIPATNTRGSDSLLLVGCMSEPYLARPRRHSSSNRLLNKFGPIRIGPGALFGSHTFSSDWVELYRGPKAHYLIWGLYPYNNNLPSKICYKNVVDVVFFFSQYFYFLEMLFSQYFHNKFSVVDCYCLL